MSLHSEYQCPHGQPVTETGCCGSAECDEALIALEHGARRRVPFTRDGDLLVHDCPVFGVAYESEMPQSGGDHYIPACGCYPSGISEGAAA